MSTANKLTYLNDTKQAIKNELNRFGADLTENDTFRSYSNLLNDIYDKLPKVSGNGSNFTLENAQNGKLDLFEMEGNTIQGRLPSEYTQVDYIESSGNQYIDTGVNADSNLRVVLDLAFTEPTLANQNIGAINVQTGTIRYHILTRPNENKVSLGLSSIGLTNTINLDNNRHLYDIKPNEGIAIIDEQTFTISSSSLTFDTEKNFYLFGRNSTGSIYLSKVKQWACKMYYNNVLVRDFIPCYRNSDNVVGLYDLVNDVFYTNQGTGAFTYGAIAPTPDSPIDIEVVTGEQTINIVGKNLFDKDNANVFTGYISGSNLTINSSDSNRSLYIECKPNTTYTIQKSIISENKFRVGTSNTVPTTSRALEDVNIADSSGSITLTTSANAHYLIVHFYNTASESTIEQALATIQIEKGNLATDWEAYHSQDYEIDLHGKNLFDGELELGGLDYNTGQNITNNNTCRSKNYIKLGSNATKFILILKEAYETGQTMGFRFYDKDYNYIGRESANNVTKTREVTVNNSLDTSKQVEYLRFVISTSNDITKKIAIRTDNGTTYEPYYDYKPCKIGDYKDVIFKNNQLSSYYDSTLDEDSWYIKKEINKVVLDGNINALTYFGNYGVDNKPLFYIDITDILRPNNYNIDMIRATHYKPYLYNGGGATGMFNYGIRGAVSNNRIYIRDDRYTNANDINSWLSTHNTIVYYVLATPTCEEITNSTLISQLETIETETGTNNFEVSNDNNVLPSLNVKRLKELDKLS